MDDSFAVLLVADRVAARHQLAGRLEHAGCHVISEAGYGQHAVSRAGADHPELAIVFVDAEPGMALATIERLSTAYPVLPILAVDGDDDVGRVRAALLAGAGNVVSANAEPGVIAQAVTTAIASTARRAGAPPSSGRVGSILTICGAKGGIGKTTIATTLASAVARSRQSVAVLDLDHQFGAAALAFGLDPGLSLDDLLAIGNDIAPELLDTATYHHPDGVDVVAFPARPGASLYLDGGQVRTVIAALASRYDWIIVDTPPMLHSGIRAAMAESTLVFVVTSLEVAAVRSTRTCLDFLRERALFSDTVRVIVNRANAADGLSRDDLAAALGAPIALEIPFDPALQEAMQGGQSFDPAAGTPAATAVANLVRLATGIEAAAPLAVAGATSLLHDGAQWLRQMAGNPAPFDRAPLDDGKAMAEGIVLVARHTATAVAISVAETTPRVVAATRKSAAEGARLVRRNWPHWRRATVRGARQADAVITAGAIRPVERGAARLPWAGSWLVDLGIVKLGWALLPLLLVRLLFDIIAAADAAPITAVVTAWTDPLVGVFSRLLQPWSVLAGSIDPAVIFSLVAVLVAILAGGELAHSLRSLGLDDAPRGHRSARFATQFVELAALGLLLILGLRLFFAVLAVDPTAPLAAAIAAVSRPLVAPFWGMFPTIEVSGAGVFEFSTVFAFLAYAAIVVIAGDVARSALRLTRASWIRSRAVG